MENKIIKVNSQTFYDSIKYAKENGKRGCYLSFEEPSFYEETENFLFEDGSGGFALDKTTGGGNLIAVHKNPDCNSGSILHELMLCALKNGANKLDCYGSFLASTYIHYGFIPVAITKFNRDYNPDFPVEKYGQPDVIAMLMPFQTMDELIEHQKNNDFVHYDEIIASLPVFQDYGEMLKYRDQLLDHFTKNKLPYEKCVEFVLENQYLEEVENDI